jgi:hypothetical protein
MTQTLKKVLMVLRIFKYDPALDSPDDNMLQGPGCIYAIVFITSRLTPPNPKNDGKQSPMKGYPAFVAPHATATCCRGCLKKWYQIEKERALTDDEIGFVVELAMK